MIKSHCFEKEWIDGFKNQPRYRRINPPVLEKMIQALYLLQNLKTHGLDFTFKGGTSLILLLNNANRFSIDIDIIAKHSKEKIEATLDDIIASSRFVRWELDERRSYYKTGVPKAHYLLYFDSQLNKSANYILLDILFEETDYPVMQNTPVKSQWNGFEEWLTSNHFLLNQN